MFGEQLAQPVAQLVHVEARRVDDEVGLALQRFEQRALAGDAVADAVGVGQRVPAAARFVPAHEHVVGGVEEQHAGVGAVAAQLLDRGGEVVQEVAAADVDDERVTDRLLGAARELGDLADEHRRQVVDDEVAEVFEHVRGLGTAGAGHAGDDRHVERMRDHDFSIVARSRP